MTELIKAVRAAEFANAGLVKVDMNPDEARREAAKREGGNASELRVAAAYRAVADGRQLIDLDQSLQKAGVDGARRPKLAICPADRRSVKLETWSHNGEVRYHSRLWEYRVEMPGCLVSGGDTKGLRASGFTPPMPPAVRRIATGDDLLFWEATWRRQHIKRTITVDPALLEHVVGSLYYVKAAWELSELEAAALRG